MIRTDEKREKKQFLVDVTDLILTGGRSDGIPRTARNLVIEWLKNPPGGFGVEPVCDDGTGYKYVEKENLISKLTDRFPVAQAGDVEFVRGDVFVCLDFAFLAIQKRRCAFKRLRASGVNLYWIVYDLLPMRYPDFFNIGDDVIYEKRFDVIMRVASGIIAISRFVADDCVSYFHEKHFDGNALKIGYAHLGADAVLGENTSEKIKAGRLERMASQKTATFLMVGTMTIRKGYAQVLDAFKLLWGENLDVKLIIVGSSSFKAAPILDRLRGNPELGRRLLWLENTGDSELLELYATSDALIYASYAEGFGLPLIEAAQRGLPIISRDTPLFREVAGEYAYYFNAKRPDDLASAIKEWLLLNERGEAPQSNDMPFLTWHESAEQWKEVLLGGKWYKTRGYLN
jgi:glycosyltransferase involved in cell wall biosynthesis